MLVVPSKSDPSVSQRRPASDAARALVAWFSRLPRLHALLLLVLCSWLVVACVALSIVTLVSAF